MKKKVFVVDDEYLIANLIETAMTDLDINHIGSGRGCLDRLTREQPDFMFVDMHMPEMTGLEVVAQMRRSPKLAKIPVIVMSANTSEFERNLVLNQDVQGYVSKPLNYTELTNAVAKLNQPRSFS